MIWKRQTHDATLQHSLLESHPARRQHFRHHPLTFSEERSDIPDARRVGPRSHSIEVTVMVGYQRIRTSLAGLLLALVLPAAAAAQTGTIAGVIKDATGAILPGVTVEASSPALIEVRAAVTDGDGQYKLVDLSPGDYVVTFTLPGFNTVKREGIELSASFTATVNAELRSARSKKPSPCRAPRRSSTCRTPATDRLHPRDH